MTTPERSWSTELGPQVPSRGSRLVRALARWALRLWRWRSDGSLPDVGKAVVIVAPHTSNWDFVAGALAMLALGLRVTFLGKHTVFRGPLGGLMRWLGGIPVDRRVRGGVVAQVVDRFRSSDSLILALSPEGTRRRVERWHVGFWYIARGAGVPIAPVALDWGTRTLRFFPPFETTDDQAEDIAALQGLFAGIRGRRPALSATEPASPE
jgi:1-acyl-sn-glycerol-3-phosphate acyltransferase